MKPTLLLMAGAAVLVLAACDRNGAPPFGPPKMKAVTKLNCPEHSGDLRRVSVAADGKSCGYVSDVGDEVTLQLVAVSGDPEAALKPIETSLAGLVPPLDPPPGSPEAAKVAEAAEPKTADKAAKDASAARATAASDAAVDAAATADADADADAADADIHVDDEDEHVQVDLPGIHVRSEGDTAEIKVFGINVDVDERGPNDRVRVRREPRSGVGRRLMVDANDNGAVIRMVNSNRSNLKSTVIYGMEDPGPQGHRVVGYVARGPRTGPLVVATIKSKRDHDESFGVNEGVFEDVTRLARRASR